MSDDALIAGAAAPQPARRIRSVGALDAIWVSLTAIAMVVSSRWALIDLPNQSLRTGAAPLRMWVVGLPLVAFVLVIVGSVRRSTTILASATGVLAPAVAFTGSLGFSLFLDDDSAFADVGVAVSLSAAFVGAVMLLRWFVYHPVDLIGGETRPNRRVASVVAVGGAALAATVIIESVADGRGLTAAAVFDTGAMLAVALVVLGAAAIRTRRAMVLAGSAALAQAASVIVVKAEQSSLPLDSRLLLRSGVVGLVLCVATVLACVAGWIRHEVDDEPDRADDDADWRWTSPD